MKSLIEDVGKSIHNNMEIVAPVTGGGVGFYTLIVDLAPLISIIAALTGVILGILSYRLKQKRYKILKDFYKTHEKQGGNGKEKLEQDRILREMEQRGKED